MIASAIQRYGPFFHLDAAGIPKSDFKKVGLKPDASARIG
jgi:hypothetical protein